MSNLEYVVLQDQKKGGVELYGAGRQLWLDKSPEVLLSGPYDCSKTFGALTKVHLLMLRYPGAKALMVRQSYKALIPSAYASFVDKILPYPPGHALCPVEVFGGGAPQLITYPNGSTIRLGGLDIPEKVLSAEYDVIFVPQAEEISLHAWEQLANRANGRAGNMPYAQIIGDANPAHPQHWILARNRQLRQGGEYDGKPVLQIYWAQHKDNPTIYQRDFSYTPKPGEERRLLLDENGEEVLTDSGRRRIATLKALTGLRYKRGYLGEWAGAEGTVYEDFSEEHHVIDPFIIPADWDRFITVDFGYTHPLVVQFWALDNDGRMYLYREMYHTKRTVDEHINGIWANVSDDAGAKLHNATGEMVRQQVTLGIKDFIKQDGFNLERGQQPVIICDHDAEDRATMHNAGLITRPAQKAIRNGIDAVSKRLRIAGDGKPRLFFMRGALVEEDDELKAAYKPTSTVDELPNYVWRDHTSNTEDRAKDEVPIDRDNHGCDALRYAVMYADGLHGSKPMFIRYV